MEELLESGWGLLQIFIGIAQYHITWELIFGGLLVGFLIGLLEDCISIK